MNTGHNLGETPSLKQQAYDTLLQMMVSGELKPGTRLTEEELTKTLNISRAPIREALNMLERDGFAKIVPRKGTAVTEVSRKDLKDIWTCRLALEPFAAREALPNIPREKLTDCIISLNRLESEPFDYEKYVASDLAVHDLFYQYLDNSYMQTILNNLQTHSLRVRWLNEAQLMDTELMTGSVRDHKAIILACLEGDPEKVYNEVYTHVKNSLDRILAVFPEEDG